MMSERLIQPSRARFTRRKLLIGLGLGAAAAPLSACSLDSRSPEVMSILDKAEALTEAVQRALLAPRTALAPEYPPGAISSYFKPNGSVDPDDPAYVAQRQSDFADWKLEVAGLVERPMKLTLADLRAMPSRSQITRHDCVEGWSCIGQWKGAPLSALLDAAGLKPQARYIAFFCADTLEQTLDNTGRYYETIDLIDAYHPQTILAYEMNFAPLPVEHGAPLRLRLERQLGYKMAKYVMRIEAIDGFADNRARPRRLLGGPRLRMVRRDLGTRASGNTHCVVRDVGGLCRVMGRFELQVWAESGTFPGSPCRPRASALSEHSFQAIEPRESTSGGHIADRCRGFAFRPFELNALRRPEPALEAAFLAERQHYRVAIVPWP